MFKGLFMVNDLGGYHAVHPIYKALNSEYCKLLLTGSAADIDGVHEAKNVFLDCVKSWFDINPEGILVTGTSWKSENEIQAVEYCMSKGITTVSVIDYWSNYKERFRLGDSFVFPDYVFIMDDVSKQEAIEEGIPADILVVAGQPVIDAYIKEKRNKEQLSNGRALFLSQPILEVNGYSLGYTEFDAVKDVIDACNELRIPLDIKYHPKESESFKAMYHSYAVEGKMKKLLFSYDIIIGMCTMGLLQSSLMERKTISYQPGLIGKDMCITNRVGLTEGAFSYNDLMDQLKENRNVVKKDIGRPIWLDGKSTERCKQLLLDIYKNRIG